MIVRLPETTVSKISKELVRIREEGGAVALGRVLTLVIEVDEAGAEAAIAAAIGALFALGLIAAAQYWVIDGLLTTTVEFLDFVTWQDTLLAIGISAGIGLILTIFVATVSIRRYLKV